MGIPPSAFRRLLALGNQGALHSLHSLSTPAAAVRAERTYASRTFMSTRTYPAARKKILKVPSEQQQVQSCRLQPDGGLGPATPAAAARPTLRSYQEKSVRKVLDGNTIVLLPTGAGKTLVAAESILRIHPRARALFLVPTCLLVTQQAAAVREWTGLRVGEFMGGSSMPADFDVLVATPKAFQIAQPLHPHLAWSSFHLIVFDEVHHVLKEHPYRQLALALLYAQHTARILGLTASLTYAVKAQHVQQAVQNICAELNIMHITTALPEELAAGGYHAKAAPAQVLQVPQAAGPEQPSLAGAPNGVLPRSQRKPHLMLPCFLQRVETRTATPFALRLVECIRAMEGVVAAGGSGFSSPIHRLPVKEWGEHAQAFSKRSRASAQVRWQCAWLEHWYEALKLLVISWEEAEDAAVMLLRMNGMDARAAAPGAAALAAWPPAVAAVLQRFWAAVAPTYPRMEHLKDILQWKLDDTSGAAAFRGILFVEQRVMTHILEAVIADDPQLRQRLRTACIYAAGSPATASLRVTASQAKQRLADFSSGAVNLLIATVVAEEGMDVPAANCVIRFDPMINAVSFVQGRGRARQADSSFLVLSEREDRPAALLHRVEQQQNAIARSYQPQQTAVDAESSERVKQQARERGAQPLLACHTEDAEANQTINAYAKKTKALLTEGWQALGSDCVCELRYRSVLRDVTARGEAAGKKQARVRAAVLLIEKLRAGAT